GSCSYPPLHSASGQSAGLSPVSAAAGNVCPVRRPCQEAGMADWSGSAVQGQTLANAGRARRSEEARQVRWLESLMPRTDRASRVIAAPPERVWAAFVNPGALMAWLPPGGMTGRFERFDARPGGSYRMVLTYSDVSGASGKATAESAIVEARFVDIVPGERSCRRWTSSPMTPPTPAP